MMALWTSQEAAAATSGRSTKDWSANGVSIDTRQIRPGDLFVALRDQRDGHDFVAQAFERGASAALVTHRPDGVDESYPLLIVDDVLKALEDLGRAARARTQARVVAVTGSNGKTSTKDMLRHMLSHQGQTHAAEASYNNHWGVPLTLARMPREAEFAVVEIGMSAAGEIAPLSMLAAPNVALVTMVGAAHLAAFASVDEIAAEKAALFEGLVSGGHAICNVDTQGAQILEQKARSCGAVVHCFGGGEVDWSLKDIQTTHSATVFSCQHDEQTYLVCLQTLGTHFAMNAVGALAAVHALGADVEAAARDLRSWSPVAGRGQHSIVCLDVEHAAYLSLLDDSFNANPASMSAALHVLARSVWPKDPSVPEAEGELHAQCRRIAVLGDMLELGDGENQLHADLAQHHDMEHIDVVHCIGPRMQHLWSALPEWKRGLWAERSEDLLAELHNLVQDGDIILVKGSKGSYVSKVSDAILKLNCKET